MPETLSEMFVAHEFCVLTLDSDGARVLAPRNHYYGPTRHHGHGRRRQSYQSSFYMNPNARDFE